MEAPCKKCELKGCGMQHEKCEKYKKYRQEIDEATLKRKSAYLALPQKKKVKKRKEKVKSLKSFI